jgi:hypothetical protein
MPRFRSSLFRIRNQNVVVQLWRRSRPSDPGLGPGHPQPILAGAAQSGRPLGLLLIRCARSGDHTGPMDGGSALTCARRRSQPTRRGSSPAFAPPPTGLHARAQVSSGDFSLERERSKNEREEIHSPEHARRRRLCEWCGQGAMVDRTRCDALSITGRGNAGPAVVPDPWQPYRGERSRHASAAASGLRRERPQRSHL